MSPTGPARRQHPPSAAIARVALGLILAMTPRLAAAQERPGPDARVVVEPGVVHIPADRLPVYRWPDWGDFDELGQQPIEVRVRVGAAGWKPGGGVQIGFGTYAEPAPGNPYLEASAGYMLGPSNQMKAFPLGSPRVEAGPGALDLVQATIRHDGRELPCAVTITGKDPRQDNVVQVTAGSEVPADAVVTVRYGGGMDDDGALTWPGMTITWHPGRLTVVVYEDPDGDGQFALSDAELPELLFTGARADAVHVHAALTPAAGSSFTFTARPMQGQDRTPESNILPVEDFTGRVVVTSSDPAAELPEPTLLGPGDRGVFRGTAVLHTPGMQTLTVALTPAGSDPVLGVSHPIWVGAPAGFLLYAGDLQRHSAEGGHAAMTARVCWQQLRDRRDDFGAVVHHVAGRYAGFQHTNFVARQFQQRVDPAEQEFIAFPAYEWSRPAEHRHVVYRDFNDSRAFTDREYRGGETPGPEEAFTLAELFDGLRQRRADGVDCLAIVHHTLMTSADWPEQPFLWGTPRDLEVQPLVEIYNRHGSSERRSDREDSAPYAMKHDPNLERPAEDGAAFEDALANGLRLGVIGGSDNHTYGTHQGRVVPDGEAYSRAGLAIVLGDPATPRLRDRIFDALQARRTYGTTGARILLHFETTTGVVMGGATPEAAPRFRIRAGAAGEGRPAVFRRLQVYRDGRDCILDRTLDPVAALDEVFADPTPPTDGQAHSYYVRLIQDDLHMAWSSPIWTGAR